MEVYLSPLAERKLKLLLDYLEENWSVKAKRKFLEKLMLSLKTISTHPYSFPESLSHKGLFKCTITKQTFIIYRINAESIEIVALLDNRQDLEDS